MKKKKKKKKNDKCNWVTKLKRIIQSTPFALLSVENIYKSTNKWENDLYLQTRSPTKELRKTTFEINRYKIQNLDKYKARPICYFYLKKNH